MDQHTNLLLSAEVLRREEGLIRGQTVGNAVAFKRISSQTYLIVDRLQAGVLAEFAKPKNVPEALENCIGSRRCPSLGEFYDLILKAHRAGMLRSEELCTDGPAAIEHPSVRWFFALKPRKLTVLAGLGALAAIGVGLVRWGAVMPTHWFDVLFGWVAVCCALSLGHVLAGAALRGAGCEVHRPRFRWRTPLPHFVVDQTDICMAHRLARATLEVANLLPLALVTLAALYFRQAWSVFPLAALFFACRPIGASPFARLLVVLRRQPLLSTDLAPLFDAQPTFTESLRQGWRRFDGRVASLQLLASIGWVLALGATTYRVLQLRVAGLLEDWSHWEKTLFGLGAALAATALLWLGTELRHPVIALLRGWSRHVRIMLRRARQQPLTPERDLEQIEELIRRNSLLGQLDVGTQMELAMCCKPFAAGRWRTLTRFDQAPDHVTLIVSGRANLFRRRKSGRKDRFLRVREGDLFGAHHLVDPTDANLQIRTGSRLVALAISPEDFQRLVIERLGTAAVAAYLQKHLFLQNSSPFCADWRPAAIARFVELADTAHHAAGGRILQRGQEVHNLYVLYEGEARACDKHKRTSTLQAGDFFGEISLLQTSGAIADIEAKDEARSLFVGRVEFIRFMTRSHHVALQMERLGSQRLGRPIFPLERCAFEER